MYGSGGCLLDERQVAEYERPEGGRPDRARDRRRRGHGGGPESFGGGAGSNSIASWVAARFTARTVGGTTVYNLAGPAS
jgi:hypothetical protein